MSHVFISHVEEDADIALQIALGLEEAGFATWCYETDSIPGLSYLIQTGQAVENASCIVLLISSDSLGSNQVTKEVVRAHESGKSFVPVLRDVTHVEFQNRQPEWREAVGSATSVNIPKSGIVNIIPNLIAGLEAMGIHSMSAPNTLKIARIHEMLGDKGIELTGKELHSQTEVPRTIEESIAIESPPPDLKVGAEVPIEESPSEVSVSERSNRERLLKPLPIGIGALLIMILVVVLVLVLGGGNGDDDEIASTSSPSATGNTASAQETDEPTEEPTSTNTPSDQTTPVSTSSDTPAPTKTPTSTEIPTADLGTEPCLPLPAVDADPPGSTQIQGKEAILYQEDFETGMANEWQLDGDWEVIQDLQGNSVLHGRDHTWATYEGDAWGNYTFKLRLKLIKGGIHLNYYRGNPTRYFIKMCEDRIYISKTDINGNHPELTSALKGLALKQWYDIEITSEDGKVDVYVDGDLRMSATDPKALTFGGIAFESLEDSEAYVDDITVIGEAQGN